ANGPAPNTDPPKGGEGRVATRLVELVLNRTPELWHTPERTGYITFNESGHLETWPLRSRGAVHWIAKLWWEQEKKTPGRQATADALATLEGIAVRADLCRRVYSRVAEDGGKLYLDLADPEWTVYEITPDGWGPCPEPPVRFRRSTGQLPLPVPLPGADL